MHHKKGNTKHGIVNFRRKDLITEEKKDDETNDVWHCHCCTAKNSLNKIKCYVCGRTEDYANEGYHRPFHGDNSSLFRPSQVLTVLEDLHEVDESGWSALHSACAQGNIDVVRELLALKAKVEERTHHGQTALHLAVHSGSLDCVSELLKYDVSINAATFHEKATALHMACTEGYALITQELVRHGADVEALNILQRTPLHCAAMSGRTDVGKILLLAGAKSDVLDMHHWDPRQIAELFDHKDFQDLMIRDRMTEKQAIIKDPPRAPWHSDLWSEVIRMQTTRRNEHDRRTYQKQRDDAHFARIEQFKQEEKVRLRREERQMEIFQYHEKKRLHLEKEESTKKRYAISRIHSQISRENPC